MKFSVLMSVYNLENHKFLEKSLESITVNQKIKPDEIVIVEDGILSKDLSNTIKFFKKKYNIISVKNKVNLGLGKSLNKGLKHCSNEWVFRMDSDDISKYNRFYEQIKFIKNNPGVAAFSSNIEEFEKTPGDSKRIRKVPSNYKKILNFSIRRNPINHMCAVFKKSEVVNVGGYKHITGYEDYYLWLRLLKKNKIILNQNLSLLYARIGNNMISRRSGYKFFIREIRFQKLLFNKGILSFYQYSVNIIMRAIPRLFGKTILQFIYKLILRNES